MYWFDFAFALQLDVQNSTHSYKLNEDVTNVNLFRLLFQLKYYLDTKDLSAPITFVGPHFILGAGMYQRTDTSGSSSATAQTGSEGTTAFGFNAGLGLELTIKPKKTYLQLEGIAHFINFPDMNDTRFAKAAGIPDKSGFWITTTASVVFTW